VKTLDGPASKKCEFYIMTSENNHEETMDYFYENNNFGIQSENIHFFKQVLRTQTKLLTAYDSSTRFFRQNNNGVKK
jgi:UDP-N-acetylglucosamine pyrophosphorylase